MKRDCMIILFLLVLFAAAPTLLYAQGRDRSFANGKEGALNLSDEQQGAIKRIRAAYMKKILQLKSDVMGKQHEFKGLIADPATSEETIRNKGREIEAINGQIMREAIEYELAVRKTLTPEQIRSWSNSENAPPIRRSSGR